MQLTTGTSRRRLVDPTQPPTLIEPETAVLWAGATVAGSRPASPSQPSLHYATDTPAVTLWDGSTWRSMGGATLPSATAAGQMLISTASGTSYAARARILSGTLAERDALSPVREGDQWYVSSGASSGTFWQRVNGAWQFRPMGANADDLLTALGAIKAPTSPTAGHVLTYDGSVWQSAAPSAAPPSRLEDAMSGTGWSTASATGGASASWATGPNRLLLTCDPGSAGSCGVYADGYLDSGDYFDVAIRLRITGGDNSNQTRVILAVGQDTNTSANLAFFTNGSVEVGVVVGGSYTYWNVTNTIAGLGAAVRAGGQLWFRVHRSPGMLEWSYGIGASDALPTEWYPVYSHVERMVAGQYAQARAGLTASNGRHVGVYALTLSGVALGVRVDDIVTGLPGAFGGA